MSRTTTTTPPVWTPTTPEERRHVSVAGLVAHVMSRPEGHRYASAYGILAGLVTSREPEIATTWATDFVREVETAMTAHPYDRKVKRS